MSDFLNSAPVGKSRRRRFAPLAVVAGVGATAALALSMTGTLSAFTAQITNTANSVTDGTLVMSEAGLNNAGAATTCTSTDTTQTGNSTNTGNTNVANCTTINKYGGAILVPGASSTASVTMSNTGTATAASFTLAPGQCSQSGNVTGSSTDLCTQLKLTVTKTVNATTTTIVNNQSLDAFYAANKVGGTAGPLSLGSVAPGASQSFTFTVTLPSGLTNSYQGLAASQQLVWLFTAGS